MQGGMSFQNFRKKQGGRGSGFFHKKGGVPKIEEIV